MSKILLVSADAPFLSSLETELESQGLPVSTRSALDALPEAIKALRPQILVLDLDLSPDPAETLGLLNMNAAARSLIIMTVTSRYGAPRHVLTGLRLGAMEYLIKPCDPRLMGARLQSVLNNFSKPRTPPAKDTVLKTADGAVALDREAHRCLLDFGHKKEELSLTPKEFRVLEQLLLKKNRLVSKNELLYVLWSDEFSPQGRKVILAQFIANLRKKLGPLNKRLKTIWGLGYRFED